MLKTLREDGFDATAFERRDKVGGLWAYSENPEYTSALPSLAGFPYYMKQHHFQEFMQEYAENFNLLDHIVFNTTVRRAERNPENTKWLLDIVSGVDPVKTVGYDKVVFCHGYQTAAKIPNYPGQEQYTGTLIHAQRYRGPEEFQGKKIVVVGLSNTTSDVVPNLISVASQVYVSHRRGAIPAARLRKGTPGDLLITWRRRIINQWLMKAVPTLHRKLSDQIVNYAAKSFAGVPIDPAWRLQPYPSLTLRLPGMLEEVLPYLADGRLTSLHGIRRFVGMKSIEFEDGTVLDDVDAVIYCTGYKADWSAAPFVEMSTPTSHGYDGAPMHRLYMNLFPPQYADSCALLCYSAFGKNNGFSFSDVMSMAISNIWRGVSSDMIPNKPEMEHWIDERQEWVASRWALDNACDISMVRQWEFQPWLHEAAGTGMENLGWGWKGWRFWLQDRMMSNLMNHGVETAHMFRYFETGKRRTWAGAREAIIHQNRVVKETFPIETTKP
ncbi:hypothetical protein QQS21_000447 [Conoideocrella luteorostrata]|uniref:Flavin-containing monooxygenase n=1 Tax=Conoideocrella luteorostrata TaxID=1105319 RepID=A0AAJ0FYH8_9HYPO|nr:hypothetical protein QQS21_000447 [Conoideocrella luteorostrata]